MYYVIINLDHNRHNNRNGWLLWILQVRSVCAFGPKLIVPMQSQSGRWFRKWTGKAVAADMLPYLIITTVIIYQFWPSIYFIYIIYYLYN